MRFKMTKPLVVTSDIKRHQMSFCSLLHKSMHHDVANYFKKTTLGNRDSLLTHYPSL